MGRNGKADNDNTATTLTRRRLLGSTGVLVGLAGCAGGGDDGDGSTPGGDSESPTSTSMADDSGSGTETSGTSGASGTETETATATQTATPDQAPQIPGEGTSNVPGLRIVDTEVTPDLYQDDALFAAEVFVENTGDQTTTVSEYFYEPTAYDADGNVISTGGSGTFRGSGVTTGPSDMQPGDQASVIASTDVEGSKDDVARYEVVIRCQSSTTSFEAEGVYCQ